MNRNVYNYLALYAQIATAGAIEQKGSIYSCRRFLSAYQHMKGRVAMTKDIFWTPGGKWANRIAFSPSEVCEMLGLARSSLSVYYKTGKLKAMKIGKHYRITRVALEEFLASCADEGLVI